MRSMKWLGRVALVLLMLAAIHGAVWFVVAREVRDRLDRAVADASAHGIDLQAGSRELAGYPWSAGVAWSAVRAGPAGLPLGTTIATDRVVLTLVPSPPWAPLIRVTLPSELRVKPAGGAAWTFASPAAVIEAPCCDPADATFAAADATLSDPGGVVARIARLGGTVRPAARALTVQADGVTPIFAGSALGLRVANIAGVLSLNGPRPPLALPAGQAGIDALIAWRDGGGAVLLDHAVLGWGPVDAAGQARLTLDPLLQPAVTATARVAGGSEGLDTLAAAGLLTPRAAQAARAVFLLLPIEPGAAVGPGRRPAVTLPITLADARLSLGGFPVLKVPAWTLP